MAFNRLRAVALAGAMATSAMTATPSAALTINLRDIGGVTGSQAQQGFAIAAKYWESVFTNNAVINLDVGYSSLGPGILGSTGSNLQEYIPISDYYAGLAASASSSGVDQLALSHLSPLSATGSLTVTVPQYLNTVTRRGIAEEGSRIAPDGQAISNQMALSTANYKAIFGGNDGTADGEIQFSSDFAFDFNPTDGITAGSYDFIGVAIHEIGHALGFLSGADDFDYSVGFTGQVDNAWWGYGLDMFRYSAPGKLDWTFDTASYFSLDGGVTKFMGGNFATGANYGDGDQASHWKGPGGCTNFLGIMNPYLCSGTGDSVTALDLALFDAIGWNVNVDVLTNPGYQMTTAQIYASITAVPEASTWLQMILGFGVMGGAMRVSRRRTSVRFAI